MRKGLMMTGAAIGTAYLLRNKKSRQKLKDQFRSFAKANLR